MYIRNVGVVATLAISILVGMAFTSLGQSALGGMIGSIVFMVGVGITITLINRNPNKIVRVLRFDYEEIERDFRILFKDNYIQFHRTTEDNAYRYRLPLYNLTMIIEPYVWINRHFDGQRNLLSTQVTLGALNAKNRVFAEKLAGLIDDMATQLPSNRNKT